MKHFWHLLWQAIKTITIHAIEIAVGVYVGLICFEESTHTFEPPVVHTHVVVPSDSAAITHLTTALQAQIAQDAAYHQQHLQWQQQVLQIEDTRFHHYINH